MSRSSSSTRRGGRLRALAAATLTPLALLVSSAAAAPPGVPAPTADSVPGSWIVTLAPGASPDGVSAAQRGRCSARVDHVYRTALRGYAAHLSDAAAAKVAQAPRVASV